jgi:predicted PurR-regulated permease PerM
MVERLFENVVSYIGRFVMTVVKSTTSALSTLIVASVVTGLYIVFWLCSPLSLPKHTEDLIQRYIVMKTFISFMYGLSTMIMFYCLGIDLPEFYGLMSFILNFIPEFGPIISFVIPIPVILLDSRIANPGRTLLLALSGFAMLKMFWSNFVEVKLIENDARMTMHPVMTLLSIGVFGLIWGPTGMMLSVPFMGMLRTVVVSEHVPRRYSSIFLDVFEGGYDDNEKPLPNESGFSSTLSASEAALGSTEKSPEAP